MSSGPPTDPLGEAQPESEPQRRPPTVVDLEAPSGFKRLLGGRGENRISISGTDIWIEHSTLLKAPLRIPPAIVSAAAVDPGPPGPPRGEAIGRFPILRRLGPGRVIPRTEGIEGWLWTSTGGSAFTVIGDDDVAPNLALVFLTPLQGETLESSLEKKFLEDVAKRSALGEPALFGVLVRLTLVEPVRNALNRLNLLDDLTDREIAPAQRRHLPTDKPADPSVGPSDTRRAQSSVPPPGMG
jgi:hypothetical protein